MATTLRELRKEHGYTQAELAKKAGIGLRSYRYYEAGKRQPKHEASKRLAKVLGVRMDQLHYKKG